MTSISSEEQYMVELINELRLDPVAGVARVIKSFSPLTATDAKVQGALNFFQVNATTLKADLAGLAATTPLLWNNDLADAADKHNAKMIQADQQSHQVAGEANLGVRVNAEGYNTNTKCPKD